jgi:hypothetical protein
MRHIVGNVMLTLLVAAASPSKSQPSIDTINIYADAAHTVNHIVDAGPRTVTTYVVHETTSGATSSTFKIVGSVGFTGVWVSETSPFATVIGTTPNGVEMGYAGCIYPSALLFEVTYMLFGTSNSCSFLEVVKHPNYPFIYSSNCSADEPGPAKGGKLMVNPDATCTTVRARESTWGRIKSLYR